MKASFGLIARVLTVLQELRRSKYGLWCCRKFLEKRKMSFDVVARVLKEW